MSEPKPSRRAKPQQVAPEKKALIAWEALLDTRAVDPVLLDMREITLITDYFIICNGTSNTHIRALGDAVDEAMKEAAIRPNGVEGRGDARWVLLDYGDVIVHIFAEEEREFYGLERLWSDAPRIEDPAAELS